MITVVDHYNAVLVDEQHQETDSDTSLQMAASRIQQASSEIKVKAHHIIPLPPELIASSPVKRRLQAQNSRAKAYGSTHKESETTPRKRAGKVLQRKTNVDQEESLELSNIR